MQSITAQNQIIKTFSNVEYGTLNAISVNGAVYFIGSEVAKSLGYSNTAKAILEHVDDEDKMKQIDFIKLIVKPTETSPPILDGLNSSGISKDNLDKRIIYQDRFL